MASENAIGSSFLPCTVNHEKNIGNKSYDTICFIDKSSNDEFQKICSKQEQFDAAYHKDVSCFYSAELGSRVVYSPLNQGDFQDYDDVRRYSEAAGNAVLRAVKAGAKSVLVVLPKYRKFEHSELATILGALSSIYVPIQYREDCPTKKQRLSNIAFLTTNAETTQNLLRIACIYESGRYIARDIGGGDPERMAPPRVAEYIQKSFASGVIKVNVISDAKIFEKEYPLFQAVNRAAGVVPRHQGRIIFLEYKPPNPAVKTLMLVGKGVTYDTGGADIKAGGIMAGMSRDKCGSAAVGGFMKVVEELKPSNIHVIAVMCMVRNSVGEECYVSDEMITSRAGIRVRVGNTDAEGRMAMADAVCQMKEMAIDQKLPDPHIFSIATLTGHAVLSVGKCSIVMDNGPALAAGHGLKLQHEGELFGDPFEISVLRKEDFDFHRGKCYGEDVLQCNNLPSSRTIRGHQTPAAFMMLATGLDKCGLNSSTPIKYSHLDIAGSAGDIPEMPTGAPILALVKTHLN